VTDIPISRPLIDEDDIDAVVEVLRSGILAAGPKVAAFEEAFADYVRASHGVAVTNGTAALIVGLRAAGIGPGDEVIVPSFTFAATANSVRLVGATPRFADVDEHTFCVTAESLEQALTAQTRGVMPVHLYGHPAPMTEILALAAEHDLVVIEDSAQAHGAEIDGQRVGALGTLGSFSFYPTKNMTTGEGGMITTNESTVADFARLYRNQGMRERYQHEVVGANERMTEVEAALGLRQLSKVEAWTERRRENARRMTALLREPVVTPVEPENGRHVYHQYTIRVPDRDKVTKALADEGIGFGIYYPVPVHRQAPYREAVELPVTDQLSGEVLSLPVRPDLSEDEIERICSVVNDAVGA
jgi:perosamine synthetase